MDYRKEAKDCVKDHVLPLHKQIYAKFDGDFDRIYSEGYNSKSYQGRVIEPGKVYELSYSITPAGISTSHSVLSLKDKKI